MQVHRVTDTYGKALEQEDELNDTPDLVLPPLKEEEAVYAMVDGSMILVRERGWQEVKLGRLFSEGCCTEINGKRGWITHSGYEACLGSSKAFTRRLERKIDPYSYLKERFIFITDGDMCIKIAYNVHIRTPHGVGLIGSGAIESAYRTVIQKRMKQSGQLWSQNSAQHMLALRCARMSGRWNKIVNLICSSKKAAETTIWYAPFVDLLI
jgi:hypothetical protein